MDSGSNSANSIPVARSGRSGVKIRGSITLEKVKPIATNSGNARPTPARTNLGCDDHVRTIAMTGPTSNWMKN